MLGLKLWKIYLTSIFTFVLGAQKNLPIEMILLSVLVENMKSNFELHFVVFLS